MLRLMDGFSEFFIVIAMSGINIETIEGKVTKRKPHPSRLRGENVPRHILFYVTVDGITKGGPAGVLLPAGMKKKYFRKSFSLSMLLSYKSDVTGV